jgi:hypothetical protein
MVTRPHVCKAHRTHRYVFCPCGAEYCPYHWSSCPQCHLPTAPVSDAPAGWTVLSQGRLGRALQLGMNEEMTMAQGDFTKEETLRVREVVDEMFNAIPKTKRTGYIGHLNDIYLYLEAAGKVAPAEETKPKV